MNIVFNKTTNQKLKKLHKDLEKQAILNLDFILESFSNLLRDDIKNLKGCSERAIVDYYILALKKDLENKYESVEALMNAIKGHARSYLVKYYADGKTFNNNIDIYFNDVKREYIKHPMSESNDLEFLPENKDIFIKNNLKLVINCAKRYQNYGISFDDLIQAGNYGLCIAFEKFDTERAKLRKNIMNNIQNHQNGQFTYEEANEIVNNSFEYTKNLSSTIDKLPKEGFASKEEFINWTKKNVKTAVFASVAFQWIRAYILTEINKNGKIIKAPNKDDEEDEENVSTLHIISLDSINPYTNDNYQDDLLSPLTNEEFIVEDENIENIERQDMFKKIVSKELYKLGELEARLLRKRFGIDLPYQLSIIEIAESENMNPNKVKYIITSALKTIGNNISEEDKQIIISLIE